MDPRTALKLLDRIQELERTATQVRLGEVTDTSPLSVALGGSDTPYTTVKALDGQALSTGDIVSVLTFGRDLLVLGRLTDGQPEDWHLVDGGGEPAFAGSWGNYSGGEEPAGFYKDPGGVVHLKGLVAAPSGTTTIFTLPSGYRPGYIKRFAVWGNGAVAEVDVTSAGAVVATATAQLSLEGITFRAED